MRLHVKKRGCCLQVAGELTVVCATGPSRIVRAVKRQSRRLRMSVSMQLHALPASKHPTCHHRHPQHCRPPHVRYQYCLHSHRRRLHRPRTRCVSPARRRRVYRRHRAQHLCPIQAHRLTTLQAAALAAAAHHRHPSPSRSLCLNALYAAPPSKPNVMHSIRASDGVDKPSLTMMMVVKLRHMRLQLQQQQRLQLPTLQWRTPVEVRHALVGAAVGLPANCDAPPSPPAIGSGVGELSGRA